MRRSIGRALCVLILLVVLGLGPATPAAVGQPDTTPTLTAEGIISYAPGAGAVVIDPDLTVTGSAGSTLDAALVSISTGFRPGQDMLGISGQEGTDGTVGDLSWSYNPESGMLTLSGEGTLEEYEAALRQVTFSNSRSTDLAVDRLVAISLGSPMYYPENGHFYDFIVDRFIPWTEAKAAAEAMTYAGMQGYLVTITSAGEGDFVEAALFGNGWMGASDAGHDKEWYWETGPEAGTHFFTQAADEDGCGEGPAAEQPPGDYYENWDTRVAPEPNDFPGGCTDNENYGHILSEGSWNDWPDGGTGQVFGYMIEFGGMEGDPENALVGTILIQANEPSITIEKSWDGDDSAVDTSFTVTPEVDGCTDEQVVSLPAGESSVDVSVEPDAGEAACTYTVTETVPVGYTASPNEVTAVAVDDTAAFLNTEAPLDALPTTGSTSSVLIIVGLVLAGSGSFLVGGGRRRDHDSIAAIRQADPVAADPAQPDCSADPVAADPVQRVILPPLNAVACTGQTVDLARDAAPAPDHCGTQKSAAVMQDPTDRPPEPLATPTFDGAHAIVEDLLQLMDDLSES